MLKGIDPLITPELLKVLAEMGHGDELIVADTNFTAATLAREAGGGSKPLIRVPCTTVLRMTEAVLSLLPLGTPAERPVGFMKVCHTPDGYASGLQRDVQGMLRNKGWLQPEDTEFIERFAFYERTRRAFAIVLTGDPQPYGNVLIKKGVIGEPLRS
jgi:L-fucose mutarotase